MIFSSVFLLAVVSAAPMSKRGDNDIPDCSNESGDGIVTKTCPNISINGDTASVSWANISIDGKSIPPCPSTTIPKSQLKEYLQKSASCYTPGAGGSGSSAPSVTTPSATTHSATTPSATAPPTTDQSHSSSSSGGSQNNSPSSGKPGTIQVFTGINCNTPFETKQITDGSVCIPFTGGDSAVQLTKMGNDFSVTYMTGTKGGCEGANNRQNGKARCGKCESRRSFVGSNDRSISYRVEC